MQFEIRSDIPLPQHRRGSGRKRKIPLDKLKLRECVVHPGGPIRASAAASYANRTIHISDGLIESGALGPLERDDQVAPVTALQPAPH